MSAAALRENYISDMDSNLKIPLVFSMLFHLGVMAFAYYGIPYVRHDRPIILESVTVDIIGEENTTDKPPERRPAPPVKNEMPAPPPARPVPPKVTADTQPPPKLEAPKPPDLVEDISKPVTPSVPMPKPEEVKKKPEEIKKKPVEVKEKPKTPPPPPAEAAANDSEKQNESFNALLRNLTPHAPDTPQQRAPLTAPIGDNNSPLARFAQQVSMGEMDALRQQLAACWNIPAGAKYAENLVVDIRLVVNPDRTVNSAEVINPRNDQFFRTAAESAIRAVYSPRCNPLNLPAGKYDQWKTIVVTFDPREMLQ